MRFVCLVAIFYTLTQTCAVIVPPIRLIHQNQEVPKVQFVAKEDNIDKFFKVEDAILDTFDFVDAVVSQGFEFTSSHRKLFKGLVGVVLCLYGGNFYNTILLAQALSVSGFHSISRNIDDLVHHFRNVRKVMKDVESDVKSAKGEISSLAAKFSSFGTAVTNSKNLITNEKGSPMAKITEAESVRRAFEEMMASKNEASTLSRAAQKLQDSINVHHVQVRSRKSSLMNQSTRRHDHCTGNLDSTVCVRSRVCGSRKVTDGGNDYDGSQYRPRHI